MKRILYEQVYPRKNKGAFLGYSIKYEWIPDTFNVYMYSASGTLNTMAKSQWGKCPNIKEGILPSNYAWYIPIIHWGRIDMETWNKFLFEAYGNPILPHKKLTRVLYENFYWYEPVIKFYPIHLPKSIYPCSIY